MKTMRLIVMMAVVGLCWAGCDTGVEETATPPKPETVGREEAEEPDSKDNGGRRQGYIGIVVRAPASTAERTAVLNLENTLQQYRALHGQWPDSLQELKDWTGAPLPELPAGRDYHYNPETGEVKISQEKELNP